MVEQAVRWNIQFTDPALAPTAGAIVDELHHDGDAVAPAAYKRPREAELGTPEIIITVLVTAAAKAVIIAGIRAIERVLAQHLEDKTDKRAQVVLESEDGEKIRHPVSLKGLGRDALKQFIDDVIAEVGKL
jgi:hypothetical protein